MINPFELQKERLLVFSEEPANQIFQAYLLLIGLDDFHVEKGPQPNSLLIRYSVQHYSLEALEKALSNNSKIIVPSDKELINVIGEMAGVLPIVRRKDDGGQS